MVLQILEGIADHRKRFEYYKQHRQEIALELQLRAVREQRTMRTDLEKFLNRDIASQQELAQVMQLSESMLSQVKSGYRCLSSENLAKLKLLVKK
jgi:hypothetical protein